MSSPSWCHALLLDHPHRSQLGWDTHTLLLLGMKCGKGKGKDRKTRGICRLLPMMQQCCARGGQPDCLWVPMVPRDQHHQSHRDIHRDDQCYLGMRSSCHAWEPTGRNLGLRVTAAYSRRRGGGHGAILQTPRLSARCPLSPLQWSDLRCHHLTVSAGEIPCGLPGGCQGDPFNFIHTPPLPCSSSLCPTGQKRAQLSHLLRDAGGAACPAAAALLPAGS